MQTHDCTLVHIGQVWAETESVHIGFGTYVGDNGVERDEQLCRRDVLGLSGPALSFAFPSQGVSHEPT